MQKLVMVLAIMITPFMGSIESALSMEGVKAFLTCSSSSAHEIYESIPISLIHFEFVKIIGRGSYGIVYLVEMDGKSYALKAVDIHAARDYDDHFRNTTLSRLIRERDMLVAASQSEWVAKLHFAFVQDNFVFYVMEYGIGGNLFDQLLSSGYVLSLHCARLIMSEIIAAVKALHALDIEHKDLKWDNFVIDAEGHLKLIDFGYAMRRTDITIAKLKNFHKTEQWWIVLDWYLVSEMLNELHIQENTLMLNPKKDNIIFAHQKDLVRKLCALDYHETVFNPIEDTKSIHQNIEKYVFFDGSIKWGAERTLKPLFIFETKTKIQQIKKDVSNILSKPNPEKLFKASKIKLSDPDLNDLKKFHYVAPEHRYKFPYTPPAVPAA